LKKNIVFASLIIGLLLSGVALAKTNDGLLLESRKNTVKIVAPEINSAGTGFFLDPLHVITCFHVISSIKAVSPTEVQWQIPKIINVTLSNGESIPATCVSIPTQQDSSALNGDFAILKLSRKPKLASLGLPLHKGKQISEVGADVIFSGYPLGAPTMLTHRGSVSGVTEDQKLICIQAPINKGNSGGALLNVNGEVIGIISSREGGISEGLDGVAKRIADLEEGRSGIKITATIGGVNTLAVTKELISTIDRYISTGIGYARSIKSLQEYIEKHPKLLNE
jgi:S1-C subfamily serine protease